MQRVVVVAYDALLELIHCRCFIGRVGVFGRGVLLAYLFLVCLLGLLSSDLCNLLDE